MLNSYEEIIDDAKKLEKSEKALEPQEKKKEKAKASASEEPKVIKWIFEGKFGRISERAYSSAPQKCSAENIRKALDTRPGGYPLGEWNVIKEMKGGKGIFELKIMNSNDMRWYGGKAEDDKVEFKNACEKGWDK